HAGARDIGDLSAIQTYASQTADHRVGSLGVEGRRIDDAGAIPSPDRIGVHERVVRDSTRFAALRVDDINVLQRVFDDTDAVGTPDRASNPIRFRSIARLTLRASGEANP